MKRSLLFIIAIAISGYCLAQVQNPVHWSYSTKKIDETTYEVHLTATIDNGWHTYSQTTPGGGPVHTTISFTRNPLLMLDGTAKEIGKMEEKREPLFGVDVKQFSDKVDFVQLVKTRMPVKTFVKGSIEFMVCDDKQCLPPSAQAFSVGLE